MTNKELRKLTREDLLELLLEQADAVEKQQRETDNMKKKCSRLEEENDLNCKTRCNPSRSGQRP